MRFRTVGFAALFLLTIPGVVRAEINETSSSPVLVIRTYDIYQVSTNSLRIAQDAAAAVLSDVGIEVRWIDCGYKDSEAVEQSERCALTPAPNELLLRVQAKGPVGSTRHASMGFTVVSRKPGGYRPVFSTVFADVVAAVARDAGVDAGRLLGLAFAHEIGHLLLNTSQHSTTGLMRALWSRLELQERRTADWVFSGYEAKTMRQAVAARNVGP